MIKIVEHLSLPALIAAISFSTVAACFLYAAGYLTVVGIRLAGFFSLDELIVVGFGGAKYFLIIITITFILKIAHISNINLISKNLYVFSFVFGLLFFLWSDNILWIGIATFIAVAVIQLTLSKLQGAETDVLGSVAIPIVFVAPFIFGMIEGVRVKNDIDVLKVQLIDDIEDGNYFQYTLLASSSKGVLLIDHKGRYFTSKWHNIRFIDWAPGRSKPASILDLIMFNKLSFGNENNNLKKPSEKKDD